MSHEPSSSDAGWSRRLFEQLAPLSQPERLEMLHAVRSRDPDTAAEVETLLMFHDRADSVLDRPPTDAVAMPALADQDPTRESDEEDLPLPALLGRYTLMRILGVGGMGAVYEGQQASPRRPVAIKLIRPEMVSASVIRRFEHEAEALGMVDHPCIARVYEAGRAQLNGSSRAFIAMELVRGVPLTDYAARPELPPERRIALIADVCDAIQAAHRRGVIHRDLKPANILVGPDARPRVLDFGVARFASEGERAGTLATRVGQIVGTLAYMSPEQAAGDPARVDSRSDVYSLGALLFELLCGRPPVDVSGLFLPAALGAIQSSEPQFPQEVVRHLGRDARAVMLRALEKDPARRYQHASELADDLRRLLRAEPVAARPASRLDQVVRFCRRNRELVAAAALVICTLVVAVAVSGSALLRERHARAEAVESARHAELVRDEAVASAHIAQRNYERAKAVTDFMRTLLGGVRAEVARGKDTSLLYSILEESERALPMLDAQPTAKADSHTLLGDIFRNIGDFDRAEGHYLEATELYRETLGENQRATAVAMHNLGALYRGSLRRYDDAEPLLRRAVEIFLDIGDDDDVDIRASQNSLALLYLDVGRYAEAEPVLRDLRMREERADGPNAASAYRAMHNHAGALSMLGRIEEAYELAQLASEGRARLLGDDHPSTITSTLFLATMCRALRRPDEALPLVERCVEIRRQQLSETHQATLSARGHLAATLRDLGRLEDACDEATAVFNASRATLGEAHIDTLHARMLTLELRILLGRCDGALEEASGISGIIAELGPRDSVWATLADLCRGLALACEGHPSAAEAALRRAYDDFEGGLTRNHRFTLRAAELLAWYYQRQGLLQQAAEWEARALPRP